MGRPGAGGGGGGRSSGGHSSSRSSGGHRIGSSGGSSRPRGGSSFGRGGSFGGSSYRGGSFGGGHRGGYNPPPRGPRPPRHHGGYRGGGFGGVTCSQVMVYVIVILILLAIIVPSVSNYQSPQGSSSSSGSGIAASTYNREKLDSGIGFQNNCIIDNLGWFDNISSTEKNLQSFFNKTGVQPYIILEEYMPEVTTDTERLDYAEELYEEYIDNESTFLYVYFEESDPNEIGYMTYVAGKQTTAVMDAEAVEIFWGYMDQYWYDDISADTLFVKVFDATASRIMTKTTTSKDVMKYVLIVVAAGVGVAGVVTVIKLKHKRAKEEAEETERILNTPMESLVDAELKEKIKKYDETSGEK